MNSVAIGKVIELTTVAIEAMSAASRISALIAQRQAANQELTEEDWAALLADRSIAQSMLLASIRKRQTSEG